MTRFARAKGSKSSNQKAPEDSTPWEVMKEQIDKSKKENEDAKHREQAEQQRIENYNNFLKEQKVQKRKATWCDFPQDKCTNSNDVLFKKKKKDQKEVESNNLTATVANNDINGNDGSTGKKKKKKNNKPVKNQTQTDDNNISNQSLNSITKVEKDDGNAGEIPNEQKSKKKNKKKKLRQQSDTNEGNQDSKNVDNNNGKTNFNEKESEGNTEDVLTETNQKKNNNVPKSKNKKNKEPARRKEINDRSFQLIVNGKEIELIRYDGFPIMKKDAERLEELKNSMIKKGIPKSEVQRTMKLERRRAEKALARVKREVCYNCRKGGHNLSDCPDLKTKIPGVDSAEGVCFKCGSTEHRQFECKVQRDKEFRFATCFICKEAGHIARQCPDNPRGLYPNGGSCKLCGDVTHLKKDCPTTNSKKEETCIKLQTLDSTDNIEAISQKVENKSKEDGIKKPKKIRF